MTEVAVVVNPVKVGDLGGLKRLISQRSVSGGLGEPLWLETTETDPGEGMVAEALSAGARLILACGGDGTVAACASALADCKREVALAIVPVGTGNLLARNLELPLEVGPALEVAFGAGRRRLDVLDAGDHRYVVMAGLGFDAAMIRDTDEDLKGRIGWVAYLGGIARALRRSPRACFEVRVDGGTPIRRDGVGVLVGNVGRLQAGLAILPDALPDDGLLDVIVLAPQRLSGYLALIWRVLRRRPDDGPQAEILRGSTVTVRAERPVPVEYDGDFAGEVAELSVIVLPGALTLCTSTA